MKKITAVILAFILLSTFAVATHANEEVNFPFLKAFSMVGEDAKSNMVLTRAGLAEIYYRITMQVGEIPEGEAASAEYSDVDASLAPVVETASKLGIMRGSGDGTFNPNGNVTYIQLLKTMITFLGYGEKAEYQGGYPMGYYSLASELGLTHGAPADMNYFVTYEGAAAVFKAAANVDIAKLENGKMNIEKDVSYLSLYYSMKKASGVVTEDNFTDMDDNKSPYYGHVKINSIRFNVLEGAARIIELGGSKITFFYTDDGGIPEIYYFEEENNTRTEIKGEDVLNVTDSKIEYMEGDKERYIYYGPQTTVVFNGSLIAGYNKAILNPFGDKDGSLTCVDNDGDKTADVIYISAFETMVVGSLRDGIAYSKIRTGQSINLNELGEAVVINAAGDPIFYGDISEDDILSYEKDVNGIITKVIVTIDIGSGMVDEIEYSSLNKIEQVVISGKAYKFACTAQNSGDAIKIIPGSILTLYFNCEGKVGDFVIEPDSVVKKGIAVAAKKTNELGDDWQIKIFTAAQKFEVFSFTDRVRVGTKSLKPEETLRYIGYVSGDKLERQLIKYTLDENGKINHIILAGEDGLYLIDGFDGQTSRSYRKSNETFGLKAYTSAGTMVFVIPPEENRDDDNLYAIRDRSLFGDGSYNILAYSKKKDSIVIENAVYISTTTQNPDLDKIGSFIVIESIVNTIDEEGIPCIKIRGYGHELNSSSKIMEIAVEDKSVLEIGPNNAMVETGDVLKISINAAHVITNAKLILDKSENKLYQMTNPSDAVYPSVSARYTYGKVVHKEDGFITVELVDVDGSVSYESYSTYRFSTEGIYYTAIKKGKGRFDAYGEDKIFESEVFGDEASYAFVYFSGEWWIGGVIYND